MVWDHNLFFPDTQLGQFWGNLNRSFLGLSQPVKLTGINNSLLMNNFYLLKCTPQSSKLCSEHVMLPFLWVRGTFLLGLALQKCCQCQCVYSCLSICNCCSHIILTYHPHSSAKLNFQIAGTMRNLRRLHSKVHSQNKCQKRTMKVKSWFKVSG